MHYTKIDWPKITGPLMVWNPIVGCKRNCTKDSYGFDCYAQTAHYKRHIAFTEGKLQKHIQYAKPFNKIQVLKHRFIEPLKRKKPATIFINSVSDPEFWKCNHLDEVISVCVKCPQHTFLLLTKGPDCCVNWNFPNNIIVGVTVTGAEHESNFDKKIHTLNKVKARTFISFEPVLGKIPFTPTFPELIIMGADSSKNPVIPKKDWILSVNHPNIYYKKSLKKYL